MRLIPRHLKMFYLDPLHWIISVISVVVILCLYFMFIRDFTLTAIEDMYIVSNYSEQFTDFLMVGGLLIVIASTTCIPISSILVKDKESNVIADFKVAPLSNFARIQSYVFASMLVSVIATMMTFFIVLVLFKSLYDYQYKLSFILQCMGYLLLASYISALLLMVCSYFFKKMTSFAGFGNLFGVIIGFLTGVYIPIGYYPEMVQSVVFLFPLGSMTSSFRSLFVKDTMNLLCLDYPDSAKELINTIFGMQIEIANQVVSQEQVFLYFIFWIVVLNGLLLIMKD